LPKKCCGKGRLSGPAGPRGFRGNLGSRDIEWGGRSLRGSED
jgi:hypothetical protein